MPSAVRCTAGEKCRRVGVQQEFEHVFNGVAVDLNSFDAAFLK